MLVVKYDVHKEIACPNCKAIVNSTATDNNRLPEDGDLSICVDCAQVNYFAIEPTGSTKLLKFDDWDDLDSEEIKHLRKMQNELKQSGDRFKSKKDC